MTPLKIVIDILVFSFALSSKPEPAETSVEAIVFYSIEFIYLAYSIVLAIAMFQRRCSFVILYSVGMILFSTILFFNALDVMLTSVAVESFPPQAIPTLISPFIPLVWILYVRRSQRVKNVFVR